MTIDATNARSAMMGMLDRAAAAALAAGIPQSKMWLEYRTGEMDERLMWSPNGPPKVGDLVTGTPIARVWLEPLDINALRNGTPPMLILRYEGIALGAPMPPLVPCPCGCSLLTTGTRTCTGCGREISLAHWDELYDSCGDCADRVGRAE